MVPRRWSKKLSLPEQEKRIAAAADVLRPLNADILLRQEVRDYEACAKLGEAIKPGAYQVAKSALFVEST